MERRLSGIHPRYNESLHYPAPISGARVVRETPDAATYSRGIGAGGINVIRIYGGRPWTIEGIQNDADLDARSLRSADQGIPHSFSWLAARITICRYE